MNWMQRQVAARCPSSARVALKFCDPHSSGREKITTKITKDTKKFVATRIRAYSVNINDEETNFAGSDGGIFGCDWLPSKSDFNI